MNHVSVGAVCSRLWVWDLPWIFEGFSMENSQEAVSRRAVLDFEGLLIRVQGVSDSRFAETNSRIEDRMLLHGLLEPGLNL